MEQVNLPPVLRQRYFDANGAPLAGGKIYTYQAGTTTPQATYTDSGGLTPNTNPVVLDANGEAAMWLDPSLSYKFVVKNSSDVIQFTTDNVIGLLTSDSVGTSSLKDGAVTTAKLADDSVTAAKLKDSASTDADRAVTTNHIRDLAVTKAKIETTQQIPTGVMWDYWGSSAPSGWVLGSGGTIGNASSGGTERANADTETLFTLLWNSTSNTDFPIQNSSGSTSGVSRGVSASADFAANRRFPLPDVRGRVIVGIENMGGTMASRMSRTLNSTLTSGSASVTVESTTGLAIGMKLDYTSIPAGTTIISIDSVTTFTMSANATATVAALGAAVKVGIVLSATLGASGGSDTHLLTGYQSGLPDHTHPIGTLVLSSASSGGGFGIPPGGEGNVNTGSASTPNASAVQSHPNVQPSIAAYKIIKL